MAIYHASTKPIARSAGRSAVAAAAYRAGVELVDARTGLVHDYTRKGGVEHTEILTPDGLGAERNALWDAAELAEKRKDARTAREWIIALPSELSAGQRTDLARDFAQALVDRYGVAADFAIHAHDREGDHRNHHAHLLTTTRQVRRCPDGDLVFGDKAHIELSDRALRSIRDATIAGPFRPGDRYGAADEVQAVRELWERVANAALSRAGVGARIDARSLEAQGIDREATQHLGPVASEMERRGKESDRGDGNRQVAVNNVERNRLSAEIIDLHTERARREDAREGLVSVLCQVRDQRELRERRAVLTALLTQVQSEKRKKLAEKDRQAQAERDGRRQKLLELTETLRNDADGKIDLRACYPSAGYLLEGRDGKSVWVYPHADLDAERDAVFKARKAWNGRKQERLLDASAREERRNGMRAAEPEPGNPARPSWAVYRERVLTEAYGQEVGLALGKWVRVDLDRSTKSLHIHNKALDLTDYGDRIVAGLGGTGREIEAMLQIAGAKGWKALTLTGSEDFQMRAGAAALAAGFDLADGDLERRIEADLLKKAKVSAPEQAPVLAESPPSSEVVPGIRYLVEETADHVPYKDKHGEVMLFESEAQAFEFRKVLRGTYPIVRVAVDQALAQQKAPDVDDIDALERAGIALLGRKKATRPAPAMEPERSSVPVQEPVQGTPIPKPITVSEHRDPDAVREAALIDQQERETRPGIRHADRSRWAADRSLVRSLKYDNKQTDRAEQRGFYCRWMDDEQGLLYERKKDGATFIDQGPVIVAPYGARHPERDASVMIVYAQAARGWEAIEITGDETFRLLAAKMALEDGLTVSDPELTKRAEAALDAAARRERLVALADALVKDQKCGLSIRQAYLDAGYELQQQGDKQVLVYPHDDMGEERQAVRVARQGWDQRKQEQKMPRAQISAYGAEYARRDGWKGSFTGAVIAIDEGHVYVGSKGAGSNFGPHCIAIPKERFKTQPSVGLYATFTQGDEQRPAGWSKVLGKMNGQGRLVRDQEKGQGIGD